MIKLSLGSTIAELAQARKNWEKLLPKSVLGTLTGKTKPASKPKLKEVATFGDNPGNLKMFKYVPRSVRPQPPLVLVLHGCTQNAADYDHYSGWSTLADKGGFTLLFAEQQKDNNANTCFNWFAPGDIARGKGEAASIHAMIERMARDHCIDRRRVFVSGLSAGGAMVNVMLATYPETFAGGAIIAGLPYGSAANVMEALNAMKSAPQKSEAEWGQRVRDASSHKGPWPMISIWHGEDDKTVALGNAKASASQWTNVHGLKPAVFREMKVNSRTTRRIWDDTGKRAAVELYTIKGLGHGTPLDPGGLFGAPSGTPGPFMLDAGISSTLETAKSWGLA
ncbi:MAG: PHB depolymerase family esterase [Beijerinckiaceae bacterium]|nr:PHB depolymerase family esterase [Beijerinckiaceae bacterium]